MLTRCRCSLSLGTLSSFFNGDVAPAAAEAEPVEEPASSKRKVRALEGSGQLSSVRRWLTRASVAEQSLKDRFSLGTAMLADFVLHGGSPEQASAPVDDAASLTQQFGGFSAAAPKQSEAPEQALPKQQLQPVEPQEALAKADVSMELTRACGRILSQSDKASMLMEEDDEQPQQQQEAAEQVQGESIAQPAAAPAAEYQTMEFTQAHGRILNFDTPVSPR